MHLSSPPLATSLSPHLAVPHTHKRNLICKSHPSDDDDDGDGVTGDDDDMATGNNGSRCACSFGSLCPASRSGHRRFGSRCALSGDGGRGGAAAHASLISRGVGPLTRRLALHAGATATTMAMATGDDGSRCATARRRLVRGGSGGGDVHTKCGGNCLAAEPRRQQSCGGAQRDCGGSLAMARQRRQLGGGATAAAARWRRSAQRRRQLGRGSLAAARRRRQRGDGAQRDCGGSLAAARWRRQLGGGSAAASVAERCRPTARRRRQLGWRGGGGSLAAAARRRQLGGGSMAAAAARWWRQRGGSCLQI